MIRLKEGFSGSRTIIVPHVITEMIRQDHIAGQLYITDIGYYPHARYHFRERPTPIQQYVLLYCIKGRGWVRIDRTRYELHPDQYVILPAGKPHAYGTDDDDPWTIYWIHFDGKQAGAFAEGADRPCEVSPNAVSRLQDRIQIFESILTSLQDDCYSMDNQRYVSCLLHYFMGSLRYVSQFRASLPSSRNMDSVAEMAIHYMNERLERKLSLAELASFLGYSVAHVSHLFRAATGHSPLAYFNMLKVKEACRLLETQKMTISQVSRKVGIDDPYYFSRLFTNVMGMSPRHYRQEVIGNGDLTATNDDAPVESR